MAPAPICTFSLLAPSGISPPSRSEGHVFQKRRRRGTRNEAAHAPALAAAGHHGVSAHGLAAVRRARTFDQRAQRGDEPGQGNLSLRTEEREDERTFS